jgi:YD repeat-containing protein
MKKALFVFLIAIIFVLSRCSDDAPKPVNKAPGAFEVTATVNANAVELEWTAATDPDGDPITYDVILNDTTSLQASTVTRHAVNNLAYETQYNGKVIAHDGKGETTEVAFTFTSGFLFLKSYEIESQEYFLHYNDAGELTGADEPPSTTTAFTRNSAGQIVSAGEMSFQYNSGGKITRLNSPLGEATLVYDSKNRLLRLQGSFETTPGSGYLITREFAYNDADQLTMIKERCRSNTGDANYFTRYSFENDGNGNMARMIGEVSHDGTTYTTAATYTYLYDDKKNPWYTVQTQLTNFDLVSAAGSLAILPTHQFYNCSFAPTRWTSKNNLVKIQVQSTHFSNVETWTYIYNEAGYPVAADHQRQPGVPVQSLKWYY